MYNNYTTFYFEKEKINSAYSTCITNFKSKTNCIRDILSIPETVQSQILYSENIRPLTQKFSQNINSYMRFDGVGKKGSYLSESYAIEIIQSLQYIISDRNLYEYLYSSTKIERMGRWVDLCTYVFSRRVQGVQREEKQF